MGKMEQEEETFGSLWRQRDAPHAHIAAGNIAAAAAA